MYVKVGSYSHPKFMANVAFFGTQLNQHLGLHSNIRLSGSKHSSLLHKVLNDDNVTFRLLSLSLPGLETSYNESHYL